MASNSLLMGGHWLLLASVVSYARFVVLDAQGLIVHRQPSRQQSGKKSKPMAEKAAESTSSSAAGPSSVQKRAAQPAAPIKPAESPASLKNWVDGRRRERDHFEDEGDEEDADSTKLSKSDRKRLRKLKAQNRAA